jgi:hypothetical protein
MKVRRFAIEGIKFWAWFVLIRSTTRRRTRRQWVRISPWATSRSQCSKLRMVRPSGQACKGARIRCHRLTEGTDPYEWTGPRTPIDLLQVLTRREAELARREAKA